MLLKPDLGCRATGKKIILLKMDVNICIHTRKAIMLLVMMLMLMK